ncbi:hypothetical protein, partial [Nibrella viscosa]|uniref:hypothetical protein n=1 Tax=Nibrella viscosa TaxID=1084524 RepID=UPI0031E6188D
VITWIIPTYSLVETAAKSIATDLTTGFAYLLLLTGVLLLLALAVYLLNRKQVKDPVVVQ